MKGVGGVICCVSHTHTHIDTYRLVGQVYFTLTLRVWIGYRNNCSIVGIVIHCWCCCISHCLFLSHFSAGNNTLL